MVKVCGVARPEDALCAAQAGADMVGMIVWPKSKRSVDFGMASAICEAARAGGAEPVGVFVDESAERIAEACREISGLRRIQLHGDGARSEWPRLRKVLLGADFVSERKCTPRPMYVLHHGAASRPSLAQQLPKLWGMDNPWTSHSENVCGIDGEAQWVVIDGPGGGTGATLDWGALAAELPRFIHDAGPVVGEENLRWFLAGGLGVDNVAAAIHLLRPDGVDVSSGVCDASGVAKDHYLIRDYIERSRDAFSHLFS